VQGLRFRAGARRVPADEVGSERSGDHHAGRDHRALDPHGFVVADTMMRGLRSSQHCWAAVGALGAATLRIVGPDADLDAGPESLLRE